MKIIAIIYLLIIPMIFSAKISPYGGYLSIDEGTDFYLECIGEESEWILPTRLTTNLTRLTNNYKSILIIRSMNSNLQGPYICQTSQTFSTIILQLTQRKTEMIKQIRFMNINTNQTVPYGSNVQLNCFAQYYSEKAMDSPYLPKILWFFERKQLFHDDQKYVLGQDSLVIRNFTAIDQGVYYCRAFITLKTQILTKIYPILVQLHNSSAYSINSSISNKQCNYSAAPLIKNDTITFCNIHGYVSNLTCPMLNNTYPCSSNTTTKQTLEILPNVAHLNVESGRIYTFVCRSNRSDIIPEWIYDNQNSLSDKQITSYTLTKSNEVYLRFAPVFPGTYICRARPRDNEQITIQTSITLTTPMLMESNGISFQSSTLSEYHLKINATLFLACRPEYFDFQKRNSSILPLASLIRINDNKHFFLSDTIDGLLINRVQKNDSGMYLCLGQIPFHDHIEISYNPIMIFVSD